MSLKDKKGDSPLIDTDGKYLYREEDVKAAVQELLLRQVLKPLNINNKNSVHMQYVKVIDILEILGDFKE